MRCASVVLVLACVVAGAFAQQQPGACKSDVDCAAGEHCYRAGAPEASCLANGMLGASAPERKDAAACDDDNKTALALSKAQGHPGLSCEDLLKKPALCTTPPMGEIVSKTCCATCAKIALLKKKKKKHVCADGDHPHCSDGSHPPCADGSKPKCEDGSDSPRASSASLPALGDIFGKIMEHLSPAQQKAAAAQAGKLSPAQKLKLLELAKSLGTGGVAGAAAGSTGSTGSETAMPPDGQLTDAQRAQLLSGLAALKEAFRRHGEGRGRGSGDGSGSGMRGHSSDVYPSSQLDPAMMRAILGKLISAANKDGEAGGGLHSLNANQLDDLADMLGSLRSKCDSEDAKKCVEEFVQGGCVWGVSTVGDDQLDCSDFGICAFEACQKHTDCSSETAKHCADNFQLLGCDVASGPASLQALDPACLPFGSCVLARCVDDESANRLMTTKTEAGGLSPWWEPTSTSLQYGAAAAAGSAGVNKAVEMVDDDSQDDDGGFNFSAAIVTVMVTLAAVAAVAMFGYMGLRVFARKNDAGADGGFDGHRGLRDGYHLNSGTMEAEDQYLPPGASEIDFTEL